MEATNAEFEYDLFISYAESDRDWVQSFLMPRLKDAGVRYRAEEAFELGVSKIKAFEDAIRQSRKTLLVLSSSYQEDNSQQFVNTLAGAYGVDTGKWPVIPLILSPVPLGPYLKSLTGLDLTDGSNWSDGVERLCRSLGAEPPPRPRRPNCPYPGMKPFTLDYAPYFCGRKTEIEDLVRRVRNHRYLALIGASGSGKSSLVQAGLLPHLADTTDETPRFVTRIMRPGSDPVVNLLEQLSSEKQGLAEALEEFLSRDSGAQFLLIIDQFESLFTQSTAEKSEQFEEALTVIRKESRCTILLVMRSDFQHYLLDSPLWPAADGSRLYITPLTPAGLRAAIIDPARRVRVELEPRLVDRLIADAAKEPGVLPLLQETLRQLWAKMPNDVLTLGAYEEMGGDGRNGLQVAVSAHADGVISSLDAAGQAIAWRVLLRLVEFGMGRPDTRRQQAVSALVDGSPDAEVFRATLSCLDENRLIILDGKPEDAGARVDLSHESLIVGWPALRERVEKFRESEQLRRRLEEKAEEWERYNKKGGLLDGLELMDAKSYLASDHAQVLGSGSRLPPLIDASERAHHRAWIGRRWRALLAAITVVLLIFSALAYDRTVYLDANSAYEKALVALAGHEAQEAEVLLAKALTARSFSLSPRPFRERLLEARTNGAVLAGRHQVPGTPLAVAGDGSTFLFRDEDAGLHLWNTAQGAEVTPAPWGGTDPGNPTHDRTVVARFSSQQHWLATGTREGKVRVWDFRTRKSAYQALEHPTSISALALDPSERLLAVGNNGALQLYDVATGKRSHPAVLYPGNRVWGIAFNRDSSLLACCLSDHTVRILKVGDVRLQETHLLTGHEDDIRTVTFSPTESLVASAGYDGTVRLWDAATGVSRGVLSGHLGGVVAAAFSPDGRLLATGGDDATARIWEVASAQEVLKLRGYSGTVWRLAFDPSGQRLIAGMEPLTGTQGSVQEWSLGARMEGRTLYSPHGPVTTVAFSPDGGIVASSGTAPAGKPRSMVRITFWNAKTGGHLRDLPPGHTDTVNALAFNPNPKQPLLASASKDGTVRLWNVADGRPAGKGGSHQNNERAKELVWGLAFSPDGSLLASGGTDYRIRLWKPGPSGLTAAGMSEDLGSSPFVLSFDQATGRLASGMGDGTVRLWNVGADGTLNQVGELKVQAVEDTIWGVAFSRDGRRLAAGCQNKIVYLWDIGEVKKPKLLQEFRQHEGLVQSVALNRSGTWLASVSGDHTLRLQALSTARPASFALHAHTRSVWWTTFSPDGSQLASGALDGRVRLWDMKGLERVLTLAEPTTLLNEARTATGLQVDRENRIQPDPAWRPR